jgi:hypothetical protein
MSQDEHDDREIHRELLLRCDCGLERLDVEVWLKPGILGAPKSEIEAGYLTVSLLYQDAPGLSDRLKAAWALLRRRGYLANEVILKPDDVARLRDFARSLPDSATGP